MFSAIQYQDVQVGMGKYEKQRVTLVTPDKCFEKDNGQHKVQLVFPRVFPRPTQGVGLDDGVEILLL